MVQPRPGDEPAPSSAQVEFCRLELERRRLDLERTRHHSDVVKWVVIAVGTIISFAVIDYGKLELEKFRVAAENQRQLLQAYLNATESAQPDIWKRKLHILEEFATDDNIKTWARGEREYIERFAAKSALYVETLKIASQLVEPGMLNDPGRSAARLRFNQLYWADLPYAGESQRVIEAMIAFRKQLLAAEAESNRYPEPWELLNGRLIDLSQALRDDTPRSDPRRNGE